MKSQLKISYEEIISLENLFTAWQEFLPGKNVGQAGWDSSEAILGDVPNAYYYIMDGGGESTTARRRSAWSITKSRATVACGPTRQSWAARPMRACSRRL